MHKLLLLLSLAVFLPLQACAQEQWKEGEHYEIVGEQATETPEVLEFFSFWCGHCYNFEPLVKSIKGKLAADVEFTKVHVNFMGFTSAEVQDDATRAMMVARSLKQEEKHIGAIFKTIHVQRAPVTGTKDLRNIFMVNGVENEQFDKTVSSFTIDNMLKHNNKIMQKYRKHLSGVPNFIVNGKYQAKFTRDMNNDDIVDLVVWLSKQK
jgi:thiol:disulfide interchange protein DsbA